MRIDELKKILNFENVHEDTISFSDPILAEGSACIRHKKGGWVFYIQERLVKSKEIFFNTENAVCLYVLKDLSISYPQLQKYIPKSEVV